jgi:hypothetical protein
MAVVIPKPASTAEVGVGRELPAGAERLLAAMVRRGLDKAYLFAAAALCVELDERPES